MLTQYLYADFFNVAFLSEVTNGFSTLPKSLETFNLFLRYPHLKKLQHNSIIETHP